jgi:hypothetical protein
VNKAAETWQQAHAPGAPNRRRAPWVGRRARLMERERRLASANALVQHLSASGARCDRISLKSTDGGLGVFMVESGVAGNLVFSCPCKAVLSSDGALDDEVIGGALRVQGERLNDEQRVELLLLHARRQGAGSPFAAYVDALPTDEEATEMLPAFWPEDERRTLLGGTPLLEQAEATLSALRKFHELIVCMPPDAFPADAFSFSKLCWAHAIWASRAISLDLPGGRRECLVPLLDMMNHATGLPTSVRLERPIAACGGPCEPMFAVYLERPIEAHGEVSLNYGAKGNGELLGRHGFVLLDNPCDVHELDLSQVAAQCVEARRQLLRTAGTRSQIRLRQYLFRGGLPPSLLPTMRLLCADEGDELRRAVAAASDEAPPGEDAHTSSETPTFDWGLVDWSLDDPFAIAKAAVESSEQPVGEACERRALALVRRLLLERLGELPRATGDVGTTQPKSARREAAAQVYAQGQRTILGEALQEVQRRQERLMAVPPPAPFTNSQPGAPAVESGARSSRKRSRRHEPCK